MAELLNDNTEISFFYLSEMVNATGSRNHSSSNGLSKARLRSLLNEYGPIRVNRVVSSGGLFLVETCRAKHVRESTLLGCVQVLVEEHGALVDGRTFESQSSQQTALCVAAARGLPTIVRYLLQCGANPNIRSTGRFRESGLSVFLRDATPLDFAVALRRACQGNPASSKADWKGYDACIRHLKAVEVPNKPPAAKLPPPMS